MTVGIIGASGIGKHHAKWFTTAGCRVVAFTGTTPASLAKTAVTLENLCGVTGRGYTDYREMLDNESLDIVCICSPPEAHLKQLIDVLSAGCHVYCEKPVTWLSSDLLQTPLPPCPDPATNVVFHPYLTSLLEKTRDALALVKPNRVFGMNAQYVAAQETFRFLYESHRGPLNAVDSVYFLLESKGISGRYNSFEGIWIDMAPHAISQIIAWIPDGAFTPASVVCDVRAEQTRAAFQYGSCAVEVELGKNTVSTPKRRFAVNGFVVDYEGRADENGVYRTFLNHGGHTIQMDDLMQLSVQRFLMAITTPGVRPFVGPEEALKNLELSMMILERGKRKAEG